MADYRGACSLILGTAVRALPLFAVALSVVVSCGGRSTVGLPEEESAYPAGDGDDTRDCTPACVPGERCSDGECAPETCSQYQERCRYNREEVCLDQKWVVSRECPAGTTCSLDGSTTVCADGMDLFCRRGTTWCESEDVLLVCNDDGTEALTVSCADGGMKCSDGACRSDVCEPGVTYCQGSFIYGCSEDGTGASLVEECAPGFACLSTPFARCQEIICEPSLSTCAEGSVVRCSSDGTEWTLSDSCGPGEYCVEGAAACQPQLCVPNAAFCVGNAIAQCDSVGSSYMTGVHCGSQVCAGGTCGAGYLYFEDFETPSLSGWVDSGFGYDYSTTSLVFAGGASSLKLSGGRYYHYDGIYHQFSTGLTPTRVTFWARQDTSGAGTYFTLHDTDSAPALENEVLFVFFRDDGYLTIGSSTGTTIVAPYQPGVWYEISVTFDWPDHEFDIYVDGVLGLADNQFRGGNAANQVRRISLYHYEVSVGYWDSITFE